MPIHKGWKPKKVYEQKKRWLSVSSEVMFEEPSEQVRKYLDGEPLEFGYGSLAQALSELATWYGSKYIVGAFEGEPGARADLRRSFEFDRWGAKVDSSHWSSRGIRPPMGTDINDLALNLAKGISLGLFRESEELGRLILHGLRRGYYVGATTTRAAPLVLEVFCDWQNLAPPRRGEFAPMPDFYREIVSGWRGDAGALAAPLAEACDFHTERSREHNDQDTFEFCGALYRVFPAELLAVFALRGALGLELPVVEHPLLSLPNRRNRARRNGRGLRGGARRRRI